MVASRDHAPSPSGVRDGALSDLLARVEAAVEFDLNGGCWLWNGPLMEHPQRKKRPRGTIHAKGKRWLAHRLAYYAATGVHPAQGFVCHTCDVSLCVNPAHLYLGDHASNMADMAARARYFFATDPERCRAAGRSGGLANTWARGAGNPKATLSPDALSDIRSTTRQTKRLAALYGVHRTTIQRIRRGETWKTS